MPSGVRIPLSGHEHCSHNSFYSISMIPQVTADDVYKALAEKNDVIYLDVRTPGEFSKERIEGSINVPVDEVADKIGAVISDKNKKVYCYCLSGSRSAIAVDQMVLLGYTNIYSMTNGLLMWRAKKYPLAG